MSKFIQIQGFTDQPKDVVTAKQINFNWGKLPYIPKTQVGKSKMRKVLDNLYSIQKNKAATYTQKELFKNYKKLKINMLRYSQKQQSNLFNLSGEQNISLQSSPIINLQQKYGNKIYPKLLAIKQSQQVFLSKTFTQSNRLKSKKNIKMQDLSHRMSLNDIQKLIKQQSKTYTHSRQVSTSTNKQNPLNSLSYNVCELDLNTLNSKKKYNNKNYYTQFKSKTTKPQLKSVKRKYYIPKSHLFQVSTVI